MGEPMTPEAKARREWLRDPSRTMEEILAGPPTELIRAMAAKMTAEVALPKIQLDNEQSGERSPQTPRAKAAEFWLQEDRKIKAREALDDALFCRDIDVLKQAIAMGIEQNLDPTDMQEARTVLADEERKAAAKAEQTSPNDSSDAADLVSAKAVKPPAKTEPRMTVDLEDDDEEAVDAFFAASGAKVVWQAPEQQDPHEAMRRKMEARRKVCDIPAQKEPKDESVNGLEEEKTPAVEESALEDAAPAASDLPEEMPADSSEDAAPAANDLPEEMPADSSAETEVPLSHFWCLATLEGHEGSVLGITALGTDRVVSCSLDATLKMWHVPTGELLGTFVGHQSSVLAVAVIDGDRIISGSEGGSIKVWNSSSFQCLATLEGHTAAVCSVAAVPGERAISGGADGSVRIWDVKKKQCLVTTRAHESACRSVALVPPDRIASGSEGGTVKLWGVRSHACLGTLEAHSSRVLCVAALACDKIASASEGGTVKIWDVERRECLGTLEGHDGPVVSIVAMGRNRIVSGGADGIVGIWDWKQCTCLTSLEAHGSPVLSVCALGVDRFASASEGGTVKLWSATAPKADEADGQTMNLGVEPQE
eukprot:gnl/TRDRNA2_/TRDRNA2_136489_c0_seq1.p1 gnl/TRDRNA2_/TRDRNA2_136489_c0~~gnl/TRDRNA2_/TRDRNA2_136489_c0_seq1.p1  ORF type:complete len:595 (-),score=107.05 gnl/TRDRNA2_/TRDRNA2_136489_c0_seq1:44-1828(-)